MARAFPNALMVDDVLETVQGAKGATVKVASPGGMVYSLRYSFEGDLEGLPVPIYEIWLPSMGTWEPVGPNTLTELLSKYSPYTATVEDSNGENAG